MGTLINLHNLGKTLQNEFESVFQPKDVELPDSFKEAVKELGGYKYDYQKYLVHIYSEDLNGYIPNQWFIIASFFVDYYLEVQKYKNLLVDTLKSCGLTKSDDRKTILSMYSTELANKPKEKPYDLHKADTIIKVREKITDILSSAKTLDADDKELLINFVSDYDWWYGGKTIDRGDFYVSPILALSKVVNASHTYIAEICKAFAEAKNVSNALRDGYKTGFGKSSNNLGKSSDTKALQQIFYGAPGTGKSYAINHDTKSEDVIRTTFHPDSDYSSFVGAYKPTTVEETVMTVIGTKAVPVENADGSPRKESKIVYEFVSQAFLQAYVGAWKKFANAGAEAPQKQYLVIEEINRGNCAQIFGDLFQLLDRNDNGFSDYPIKADADMKRQLAKSFVGLAVAQADNINAQYDGRNVVKEVLEGDILLLPNNLYIWATMNTSDQSLFPIDSAFKRRWDWIYMPISNANLGWVIDVEGTKYDWWQFLEKINDKIGSTTNSEDKKLGYFFCKAKDGEIKVETFVGKVIFYLWNDVFKDFEFGDSIFDDADGGKLEFAKFYTEEGKGSKVVADKVDLFLKNLGLEPVSINAEEAEEYEGQQESAESTETEKNEWNATETKRYEFWEAFLNYAQQNEEFAKYFGGVKKASKDHWKNFFITGAAFNLVALQQRKKNAAEVQVYIFGGNEVYQHLLSYKTEIEQEMGVTYDWRELPEKKASIISERMLNVNFDDKESWKSIFNFFVDRLLRMREVFVKYSNKQ